MFDKPLVGILHFIVYVAFVLNQIILGSLGDRIGARKAFGYGLLVAGASMVSGLYPPIPLK